MDPSHFTADSPGSLQPLDQFWGGGWCYVPAPLPPAWTFPERLWPLLRDAYSALMYLEGIGSSLPNPAMVLQPLYDRESLRSSEIEGTIATAKQLLLFRLRTEGTPSATPENSDATTVEVANYVQALEHGVQSELPLCLRLLRDMHRLLMTGVRGEDRRPGEFRQIQVAIGGAQGTRFVPPAATLLPELLNNLEQYAQLDSPAHDPLVACFLAHYQFEAIHPFQDGNGRVGRLLLTLMVTCACGLTKPWLHMSEFFERRRREYYDGLYNISTAGKWEPWIEYCLQGVVEQARSAATRCQRLIAIRDDYQERLVALGGSVRLAKIVGDLFHTPLVRPTELARRLGMSYPTAVADIRKLVGIGILAELVGEYPKTYFAPELYGVAYADLDG